MDPTETLTRAEESAKRAIELDPRKADAYAELAEVYFYQSVNAWLRGQDPFPFIEASIKAASQAARMEPGDAGLLSSLGLDWIGKGSYEVERGRDPRESYGQAIQCLDVATSRDPNVHSYWDNLGIGYRLLGRYEAEHGLDPGESFRHASDAFAKAIKINASNPSVYSNLGNVHLNLAAYQSGAGIDVRPTLDSAIQNYSKAIQLNPSIPLPHLNCGTAFVQLAEYDLDSGGDPRKNLETARAHVRDGLQISTYSRGLARMGRTYLVEATYEMKRHDPLNAAARCRKWLQDALAQNPKEVEAHRYMGRLELVHARSSRSPEPYFERALDAMNVATALDSSAENHAAMADVYRWKVQWRPSLTDVQSGLDMTEKALSLNPNLAAAHAIRGSLLRVRSRITGDPAAEQQARESLRRAWEINPRLGDDYESAGEPMPPSR